MARYYVTFEKATGNGRPSKTATSVNANSKEEARQKVLATQGAASNVKVKIISIVEK
ncbi:MAG: hypothetical protein LBL13_05660 [Bacteroidales bacterium]|jgi:hypothetical protein|nr:hypothetical protein [Bacteroidales bacterium]